MKYTAIFTVLALVGIFLCFYVLQQLQLLDWLKLQPLLDERHIITQTETARFVADLYRRGQIADYVNMQVVVSLLTGVALTLAGSIGAVHLLLDKLFYRKFYESPNIIRAGRRALFWGTLPYVLGLGALGNYLNGGIILIVLLVYVLLEVLLSSIKIKTPKLTKLIGRKPKQ